MLPRILPRLYRSLRAVKVLLAALRSTLTVLASQMRGPYRFALEEQLLFSFSESAQHIFKEPKASDAQRRSYCQILPLSPNFGEYRGLRRATERPNLLGNYDKLPISRGVCNQQVVGSNPSAGSLVNQRLADSSKEFAWPLLGHLSSDNTRCDDLE